MARRRRRDKVAGSRLNHAGAAGMTRTAPSMSSWANSVIVYIVPPFSVTVVPGALSSGARLTADATVAMAHKRRPIEKRPSAPMGASRSRIAAI